MIPVCPRCGYDLSGAVAAWERAEPPQCPMEGRCSECGLDFRWRDVMDPSYTRQRRLIEHADRRVAIAFARTLARLFHPSRLWSVLRMEHAVVWPRLVALATVGVLLVGAAMVGILSRCPWAFATASRVWVGPYNGFVGWSNEFAFNQVIAWPRPVWIPPANAAPWGRPSPYSAIISPQFVVALLAMVLSPAAFVLLPATLKRAKIRRIHVVRISLYGFALAPAVLALPDVLATTAGLLHCLDISVLGRRRCLNGLGQWWNKHLWLPGLFCVAAALAWWWGTAAGRYLRLPHALGIGLAVAAVSLLAATGLIAAIPGGAAWLVWGD